MLTVKAPLHNQFECPEPAKSCQYRLRDVGQFRCCRNDHFSVFFGLRNANSCQLRSF